MAFYDDPSNDANDDLSQIPGQVSPYYQPYINAGNQALQGLGGQIAGLLGNYGELQGTYGSMLSNPGNYLNTLGAGYQESPGYEWQLDQGQQAVTNAAASGGYVGTPQEQQYMATMTEGIANQDYYNWLDHTLKILGGGLKGAQHMYDTGFGGAQGLTQLGYKASNSMAETIAQTLMAQANLDYASTVNQNQHNMGLFGDAVGLGMAALLGHK